jgi:hypothetical protein
MELPTLKRIDNCLFKKTEFRNILMFYFFNPYNVKKMAKFETSIFFFKYAFDKKKHTFTPVLVCPKHIFDESAIF